MRPTVLVLAALMGWLASSTVATAETFRRPVLVTAPADPVVRIDAVAQQALLDAYLRERVSPLLLDRRGDETRAALEPSAAVLENFRVISRTDTSGGLVRVVCEATVDTAGIAMRLVDGGVLSFGRQKPRLLLLAAHGTTPETFQALRAQMTTTLRGAGLEILSAEGFASEIGTDSPSGREAVARAALDAGAHFVATIGASASRVGGTPPNVVMLDGTLQFTLLRMYDAVVLGERALSNRAGAGSAEVAMGRIVAQVLPPLTRELAGSVAAAVFANGRVIDGSRPPTTVTINVMRRPSAQATQALIELLRERGYAPVIGPGRATAGGAVPADRLTIEGHVSDGEIFEVLADSRFGIDGVLSAAVLEHGGDTLAIDIVDARTPPAPPSPPPSSTSVTLTAAAAVEVTTTKRTGQAGATAAATSGVLPPPPPRLPDPPPSTGRRGGSGGVSGGVSAGVAVAMQTPTPTPLEFEFSAAFEEARKAGKVVAR